MSCLDDRTILDLLHGGLDEVARRRVEDELARCARCAAVVGALVRDGADTGKGVAVAPASPSGTRGDTPGPSRADRFRSAAQQGTESPCGEGPPCGEARSARNRETSDGRNTVIGGELDARDAAGDLAAIIARAMAVPLDEREPRAEAPGSDPRGGRSEPRPGARPPLQTHRTRRLVRHHGRAIVVAAVSAIVVGTLAGVSVRRLQGARDRAEAQQRIAERERAAAEDLVRLLFYELRARLTSIGRLDLLSGIADRVEAYDQGAGSAAELPERLHARAELYNLRAAVAASAGDGATADQLLEQGMALLGRAPASPHADEVRAGLLESMALHASRDRELDKSRHLYLEAERVRQHIEPGDPDQRRRNDFDLVNELSSGATIADRLGQRADAEREWTAALDIAQAYLARDPGDLHAGRWQAQVQLAIGQSRVRRSELSEARTPLARAIAGLGELTARKPRDAQLHSLLSSACLTLADVAAAEEHLDEAQRLRERARDAALATSAIEPANGTWQASLAQAETGLGMTALRRQDWALAVQHLASARTMHEHLVVRDPSNRDVRRATAVTVTELAHALLELGRAHAAQGRPREARAAWRHGADVLREIEHQGPLDAGSVELLGELDAELRRGQSRKLQRPRAPRETRAARGAR